MARWRKLEDYFSWREFQEDRGKGIRLKLIKPLDVEVKQYSSQEEYDNSRPIYDDKRMLEEFFDTCHPVWTGYAYSLRVSYYTHSLREEIIKLILNKKDKTALQNIKEYLHILFEDRKSPRIINSEITYSLMYDAFSLYIERKHKIKIRSRLKRVVKDLSYKLYKNIEIDEEYIKGLIK